MRPIRNRAKPPLRRRAPSAPWARPSRAGSFPEPGGRCRARSTRAPTHRALPWPGQAGRTSANRTPAARPPRPQVRSRQLLGRAAQRRWKAQEAAATTEDSLGAVWWGAECTCAPVCTRGSECVRAALLRAAQAGRPRGFINGGGSRWYGTRVGPRRESPRRRAPSRPRARCAHSGPPGQ